MLRACNLNNTYTQYEGDKVITNTISNETFYSVTGLLPGTTYELSVVAVSQGGDVIAESQASIPIVNTTGVTGQTMSIEAKIKSNHYLFAKNSSCPHLQCFSEWCCHGNLVLHPYWRATSDQCVHVLYIRG